MYYLGKSRRRQNRRRIVRQLKFKDLPTVSDEVNAGPSGHTNTMARDTGFRTRKEIIDVIFIVGNDLHEISAHKYVLANISPVFDAMFNGPLKSESKELERVRIPDVNHESFEYMLTFIYLGDVDMKPEYVMETYYLSQKYLIKGLRKHCVKVIKLSMCCDNVFLILGQARLFEEQRLIDACFMLIDKRTKHCINSEYFLKSDISTVREIVLRDSLSVREIYILKAVLKWADVNCALKNLEPNLENRKAVSGDLLSLIRYPLMNINEVMEVVQMGIIGDSQLRRLLLHILYNKESEFSGAPRASHEFGEMLINRFLNTVQLISNDDYCIENVRFSVNKKIYLSGFGLFGSFIENQKYDATIEIYTMKDGICLATNDVEVISDGSKNPQRVHFNELVTIQPYEHYIASTKIKCNELIIGVEEVKQLSLICDGISYSFWFTSAGNFKNSSKSEVGHIPQLLFYV